MTPKVWLVWDGNGRFWREVSSANLNEESRWVHRVEEASKWERHDDAARYAENVGGHPVSVDEVESERWRAENRGERVKLTLAWEEAQAARDRTARTLAEAGAAHNEAERAYDAAGDALGAFLARASHGTSGTPIPDGRRGVEYTAHMIHRDRVVRVKSGSLRCTEDGTSTNVVGYHFEYLPGSVFNHDRGIHSYPPKG